MTPIPQTILDTPAILPLIKALPADFKDALLTRLLVDTQEMILAPNTNSDQCYGVLRVRRIITDAIKKYEFPKQSFDKPDSFV